MSGAVDKSPAYEDSVPAASPKGSNHGNGSSNTYTNAAEEDKSEGLDNSVKDKSYQRVMTLRKPHGKRGSYTHDDGCLFIGDFDEQGVKCGLGHLEVPNGSTYDGQFQKGLPNGVGVMRFPDSSRYEGEFMQGWFHGHGVYNTIGGVRFEGEFRGGRIWGHGLLTYNSGQVGSEGYFQDSRFSRDVSAQEYVLKARKVAMLARRICSEMSYDVAGTDWKTEEDEQAEMAEMADLVDARRRSSARDAENGVVAMADEE